MPFTDVDICNMALLNVGVSLKIVALSDNTKEARACNAQYALTRDELLGVPQWSWTFARMRSILVASADPKRSGWNYIYDAPAGMLVPRRIWNGLRRCRPEQETPYAVEPNVAATGLVILTDEPSTTTTPELHSTKAITVTTLFPAYFVETLAWRMASKLVMPEVIKPSMQKAALEQSNVWLAIAIQADANAERRDPPPKDTFTASRGGST